MMIQYQRFQLGGRIEEIEVETVASIGKQYILLRDVQDVFPTAARFEREGRPVRFLSDEQGQRLEPWRIAVYPESTLQVIPQPTAKLPVTTSTPEPCSHTGSTFTDEFGECGVGRLA
ncbi:hypothetical protein BGZ88_011477 [Linnemannia elongata]|nr:hypothetical protein BGZ88_011477 [Linnemannia elongata]